MTKTETKGMTFEQWFDPDVHTKRGYYGQDEGHDDECLEEAFNAALASRSAIEQERDGLKARLFEMEQRHGIDSLSAFTIFVRDRLRIALPDSVWTWGIVEDLVAKEIESRRASCSVETSEPLPNEQQCCVAFPDCLHVRHVEAMMDGLTDLTADDWDEIESSDHPAGPCKWSLALQSLTPGGSEYVDDPDRCVAFVREVRASQHATIIKQKKELDRLRAERSVETCPDCSRARDAQGVEGAKCLRHTGAEPVKETITHAAIISPNGSELYAERLPASHYAVAQTMIGVKEPLKWPQGFYTSMGRFVDRKEARRIAVAAGQIDGGKTFQPDTLFSEDFERAKPAEPVAEQALEEFMTEMTDNVIPEIVRAVDERERLAVETRKRVIAQQTSEPKTELLPCPFCGGPACKFGLTVGKEAIIHCNVCGARLTRVRGMESVVVAAWNRRAAQPTVNVEQIARHIGNRLLESALAHRRDLESTREVISDELRRHLPSQQETKS